MKKFIFIKPVISEKSLSRAENNKEYTFLTLKSATKFKAKEAVESIYGVKVEKVRTASCPGKLKRVGPRKLMSKKPDLKKVLVKLAEGEKIEIFETQKKK